MFVNENSLKNTVTSVTGTLIKRRVKLLKKTKNNFGTNNF